MAPRPREHIGRFGRLLIDTGPDDVLRLLFICCHPDLPAVQQIALALRVVSGLTVKEIAGAFLVSESAMEQRLTRAKSRVAKADVPFETPGAIERAERLGVGPGAALLLLVLSLTLVFIPPIIRVAEDMPDSVTALVP